VLREFGAQVCVQGDSVTVSPAPLSGIRLDASQIPDLVPVIAAAASAANGETVITGITRLRIKESDRAAAVTEMLSSLGADITCGEDEIVIRGGKRLTGTTVSSYNDHRMVMCAAAVSLIADGKVTVTEAQAISKSYPGFTDDFTAMGGTFICTEDPV
jgi:3-phosphoshikimate 1-carboxyvinyltransferase